MNELHKNWIERAEPYLAHYNPNHDKLGRFARSIGTKIKTLKNGGPANLVYDAANKHDDKKTIEENLEALPESEKKQIITDKNFSSFEKNKNMKSVGNFHVATGTDLRTGHRDISIEGQSTTKVWKQEIRSKNGVHLIEEHPTSIFLDGVEHETGIGIDKRKLKTIDSFVISKEANKAIYSGKDYAAEKMLNTYRDWSDDPINRKLPDNYTQSSFSRDLSPDHITYGFGKDNKPVIKSVSFVDKYDNFAGHVIWVDYDENGKPKYASLAG